MNVTYQTKKRNVIYALAVTVIGVGDKRYKMAVSHHTRRGKVRRHTNRTFGSHMNGKCIGRKRESNVLYAKGGKNE